MAFDGITVAALRAELDEKLTSGKIVKISQPEADEVSLQVKNGPQTYRLLLSASASLPLIYLTDEKKASPPEARSFCMLLRKHLAGGRITSVTQPGMERILHFTVEHLNEMGDLTERTLIAEIMGKHSNLILCDSENRILDSIKHISSQVSSLREVFPGREYFFPEELAKADFLSIDRETLDALPRSGDLAHSLFSGLSGISSVAASEILSRAGLDPFVSLDSLNEIEKEHLLRVMQRIAEDIRDGAFAPRIYYDGNGQPKEYAVFDLSAYTGFSSKSFDSVSRMIEEYYREKAFITRIRTKSSELTHAVSTLLERAQKKYDLQQRQLKDTEKRGKFQLYGELLTAYAYTLPEGQKQVTVENYYDQSSLTIPLDPNATIRENAQNYFKKYAKSKRTYEALTEWIAETREEIEYLRSVRLAISLAQGEEDLAQIRRELTMSGYMKKSAAGKGKAQKKAQSVKTAPYHFVTPEGYHLYVGRNNLQNEELSFRFASGGDWWFHAKGIPGSHVIVKSQGEELPDAVYEAAARAAAYYSEGRQAEKVEVDYTQKKHLKKPAAAKPGFVIYHTNYSMMVPPSLDGLTELS